MTEPSAFRYWEAREHGGHARIRNAVDATAGVDLFLHQQGIDTTTPGGKAMFQMLGVFAEFERSIIQERVRAGLARPRKRQEAGSATERRTQGWSGAKAISGRD